MITNRSAASGGRTILWMAWLALAVGAPVGAALGSDQRDEVKREFTKTVPWRSGQRVCVVHSLGSVTVRTHTGNEVLLRVDMRGSADNRAEAEQFIQQIEIQVEESAAGVCFRTKYPEQQGRRRGNWSFSAAYDLTVPESAALDLRNTFGSVSVAGTKASAVVQNAHGSVRFVDSHGSQRIENTFGSIEVSNNTGDVEVTGGNGTVTVDQIQGSARVRNRFGRTSATHIKQNLTLHNDNGGVLVTAVGGSATVVNSFGSTEVEDVGGAADVQNSNGRITARNLRGGASLRTSFGNMEATDITGNAVLNSSNGRILLRNVSGSAEVTASFGQVDAGQVQKGIRVMSGNGGILINDIGGDASVRTTFGPVRATGIAGSLTAENSNGGIQARDVKGAATVRTTFSGVTLDHIGGRVDVDNENGSVTVAGVALRTGSACNPIIVRTSFAPLRIFLPDDAAYDLTARTSFGRINSDFPLTLSSGTQLGGGSVTSVSITSKIGAGGCEMRLTNSNGSIDLRKASGANISEVRELKEGAWRSSIPRFPERAVVNSWKAAVAADLKAQRKLRDAARMERDDKRKIRTRISI